MQQGRTHKKELFFFLLRRRKKKKGYARICCLVLYSAKTRPRGFDIFKRYVGRAFWCGVFFFFCVCMCVCAFDTLSQEFGLGTVTFPVATFLRKKRLTRAETSLLFWQQRRVHEGSKFNVTPFSVSFFLHSLFSFLPLFFFPLSSLLPVHTCAFHCFSRCVGNCSLSRNLKRK